jgi:hypothetical protein
LFTCPVAQWKLRISPERKENNEKILNDDPGNGCRRQWRDGANVAAVCAVTTDIKAPTPYSGYVQDARGVIARDPFGLCWRTGYWTPADAVPGCDRRCASSRLCWKTASASPRRRRRRSTSSR